jgi:flagellar biosynthesis/type III secretory pathway protein FliH
MEAIETINIYFNYNKLKTENEQLRLANTDLQMHYDYLKSEYDRMKGLGNEERVKAAFKNGYDNGYSTGYTMGYSEGLKETLYDGMPRLDDRGDNLDGN